MLTYNDGTEVCVGDHWSTVAPQYREPNGLFDQRYDVYRLDEISRDLDTGRDHAWYTYLGLDNAPLHSPTRGMHSLPSMGSYFLLFRWDGSLKRRKNKGGFGKFLEKHSL
jgi:hypothetical protein